ncbi:MFS transporter [Micrococcales bacterium 31B]|nr:MFS transporter [Micrococcales bacterium 31B]
MALQTPDATIKPPVNSPNQRWLALVVIGLAQLMIVLDGTIVNIALPSAQTDLGFSTDNRQWLVTAYSLAFGALLLFAGRITDLIGRRRAFIIGLLGFALASALGGFAPNFEMLVTARALQGVFGALLAPAGMSLLTTTFTEPKDRAKAFGIYGAISGAGGAVGLLLGGALTTYVDWRWCLFINLPIAILAVVGALTFIGKSVRRPVSVDWLGTLLITGGLFGIVFGLAEAETAGWSEPVSWGFLAGGVVLSVIFALTQARVRNPLLPLRVLKNRTRSSAYVSVFIVGIGMFAVFLFLTYYLQIVHGFSAMQGGLAFLPMVVGIVTSSTQISARLMPKVGPRPLVPTGMVLAAAGLYVFTHLTVTSSYATHVLPGLVLMGLGLGMVFSPAMSSATNAIQGEDAGVASALVNTSQQVGGSIGTALLSTLAGTALTNYVADHAASAQTPAAMQALQAQAAVHSYTTAFWVACGVFLVGAVIAALGFRSGPNQVAPGAPPAVAH